MNHLNESFLEKMQKATRAELENEFADFSAYMAVVNNDLGAIQEMDAGDFVCEEIFKCTPGDLCVVLKRYEILEQLVFLDAHQIFGAFPRRALARFGTEEAIRFVDAVPFFCKQRKTCICNQKSKSCNATVCYDTN